MYSIPLVSEFNTPKAKPGSGGGPQSRFFIYFLLFCIEVI